LNRSAVVTNQTDHTWIFGTLEISRYRQELSSCIVNMKS
jgi:hypothetical protein